MMSAGCFTLQEPSEVELGLGVGAVPLVSERVGHHRYNQQSELWNQKLLKISQGTWLVLGVQSEGSAQSLCTPTPIRASANLAFPCQGL